MSFLRLAMAVVCATACSRPPTTNSCDIHGWAEQNIPGFLETETGDIEHTPVIDCGVGHGVCVVSSYSRAERVWHEYRVTCTP